MPDNEEQNDEASGGTTPETDSADQTSDAASAEATDKGAEPKKPKMSAGEFFSSSIGKGIVFVLLLGVMGGASLMLVQSFVRPNLGPEESQDGAQTVTPPQGVPDPGELFVIEDILVNPAGTRASRFFRVGVAFEYPVGATELAAELERRRLQIRDVLITEFSSRTLDELVDPAIKEEIRDELLVRLNGSVASGALVNLYFTEYVIQ